MAIKQPKKNSGLRIREPESNNYDKDKILFSFERIKKGDFCFTKLDNKEKKQLAESIFKRKDLTWKELKDMDRHGLGFEKINKTNIKTSIPVFITEDLMYLLAFRFDAKKSMVGYRVKNIFYIIWFDSKFKLYKH